MAIIVPEVLPEPINPPRIQPAANVETFGGGPGLERSGEKVQQLAQAGGEIATFQKIRANQAAVEEAIGAKFSPKLTDLLYDPKQGALARINQATSIDEIHSIHDEFKDKFNTMAKGVAGSLVGPEQIGAFNAHVYPSGDSFNRSLMVAGDQKLKQLDQRNYQSTIDNITAQDALGYGNHLMDSGYMPKRISELQSHIDQMAFRNGWSPDQKEEEESKVFSNYHAQRIDRELAEDKFDLASKDFKDHKKDITDLDIRASVEKSLDVIPRQKEQQAKDLESERYKLGERQSLFDLMDGKLTLSENQRRFRNDEINESTYKYNEGKLSKNDLFERSEISDPKTFNDIRQAQLNKSATPNEIARMITDGQADKSLRPEDVQYLKGLVNEMPPSPRDKAVEAQANNIRDFGSRYFAQTNFLGMATGKDQTQKETDEMVADFYRSVDKSKATGEQINDIRDQIKKSAMAKKFPGLANYKTAPDIVVNVKGQIIRVLDPDQKSTLKPKYRINPTPSQDVDQE